MKKLSIFIIAIFALTYCKTPTLTTQEKKATFSKLNWIEGEWEKKYNYGKVYEKWKKINDTTYEGVSKLIFNRGYTPYNNRNSILLENENVYFIINNQINKTTKKPHRLILVQANEQEIIFLSEDKNEYPQKISYQLTTNKLKVHNSGIDEGKKEKDEHTLEKIN